MRVVHSLLFLLCSTLIGVSAAGTRPRELVFIRNASSGECTVIAARDTQLFRKLPRDGSHVSRQQAQHGEEKVSVIAYDESIMWSRARSLCTSSTDSRDPDAASLGEMSMAQGVFSSTASKLPVEAPSLKVKPLIQSGPSENRVDLVFFSDGYTSEEEDKFLEDAKRLADDVSNNQTFNTVKPLLNFWTAFTPSKESGIGVGGKPKDTPYGLYRDGTELRGVYYSKPEVARAACLSLGDQCDYPILMGNDAFYGGLGGEFTVITPSLANGALVLRHELGHSIIDVGEEYDGGFAYFGVNALNELAGPIPWSHWLSPTPAHSHADHEIQTAKRRVERSVMPMQAYPWTMLNTSAPWHVQFSSSGQYSRHLVRFSLSGLPSSTDLSVKLDGKKLEWTPRPGIGVDRWHYDTHRKDVLKDGLHELSFQLKNKRLEGTAQLCSAEILEFGTDAEFTVAPGHYALYPTFSEKNTTSYRPTNEDCLMRIVTTPNFCRVCLEGLWLSLLRRVDFIDSISTRCEQYGVSPPRFNRVLDLKLVPLGQFRVVPDDSEAATNIPNEAYSIRWLKDGEALPQFDDQTRIEVDDENGDGVGLYSVEVNFATEEVRVDMDGLLNSGGDFVVDDVCGV